MKNLIKSLEDEFGGYYRGSYYKKCAPREIKMEDFIMFAE